jgi:hypothetical protein
VPQPKNQTNALGLEAHPVLCDCYSRTAQALTGKFVAALVTAAFSLLEGWQGDLKED